MNDGKELIYRIFEGWPFSRCEFNSRCFQRPSLRTVLILLRILNRPDSFAKSHPDSIDGFGNGSPPADLLVSTQVRLH